MTDKLTTFLDERDEMLRSLDVEQALAFFQKWNPGLRTPPREVVLVGIHKARTANRRLTANERSLSKRWLEARGSESLDDGDLP